MTEMSKTQIARLYEEFLIDDDETITNAEYSIDELGNVKLIIYLTKEDGEDMVEWPYIPTMENMNIDKGRMRYILTGYRTY